MVPIQRHGQRRSPSEPLPQWLLRGGCFGAAANVQLIETHISWVFLTERQAWKIKRPVKFEFLDFSTLELRERACQAEVELNRRLAPQVYLGVLPITETRGGGPQIGADGPVVEWAVKMHRLPSERSLESLIRSSRLTGAELKRLADRLADFYERSPPLLIRTDEYRERILQHVRANRQELLSPAHELPPAIVKRVHTAQLRALAEHAAWFEGRAGDGRLVEGHGDLRPEHVYLLPEPTIIDCIEFNAEFRQLDVLDELSFLAMECDFLEAPSVGEQIMERYQTASGDHPPPRLAAFYKGYRACVRAKVAALRADQVDASVARQNLATAARYLELADGYREQLGPPPLLLVVRGLMGTGKTTLAAELADRLGIDHLQTDAVRREMFGPPSSPAEYGQQRYAPQHREAVYRELFDRADHALRDGLSVILDGTFSSAADLQAVRQLAEQCSVPLLFVECSCPPEQARQRIANRLAGGHSSSDARPEFFEKQRRDYASLPGGPDVCRADTTASMCEVYGAVVRALPDGG